MGACLVVAISWGTSLGLLQTLIGLGVVIFVHELGHFLVAKACGVKCEKFYVGFDVPISIGPWKLPSSLWKRQWGETEYGIGIVPLGGYVKMLGQDDNPANAQKEAERIRMSSPETAETVAVSTTAAPASSAAAIDPRSYPAKTVLQRMAIISAGVVMNLIFAVVFATFAYYLGVKYIPCAIGTVQPGSPAWLAGLMPGDKIVQLGKDQPKSETLRFEHDLNYRIVKTGAGNPLDLVVRRLDGKEESVTVRPALLVSGESRPLPRVGIRPGIRNSVRLLTDVPLVAATNAGLKDGDRIESVELDGVAQTITSPYDVEKLLARYRDRPFKLTVARAENVKKGVEPPADALRTNQTLVLETQPSQDLGLVMEMGPVDSVRGGSPAAVAGFKPGDVLLAVDGHAIENPLYVEELLLPRIDQTVTIRVRRTDASGVNEIDLAVTPQSPRSGGESIGKGKPMAVESIGLAYFVRDKVAGIETDGPAAQAGIQIGDEVIGIEFVAAEANSETARLLEEYKFNDPELAFRDEADDWAFLQTLIQRLPEATDIIMSLRREGETVSARVRPAAAPRHPGPERGFEFAVEKEVRRADGWAQAFQLGLRETREGILQVIDVLRNIRGLFKNVGGPIAIATMGAMEAQEGIPRLLIFLTMLSANLAVLNFLPIPVLDGGHMVFLAYEGITGKPANERVVISLTLMGMALLLSLMVFVIGNDFLRLAGG